MLNRFPAPYFVVEVGLLISPPPLHPTPSTSTSTTNLCIQLDTNGEIMSIYTWGKWTLFTANGVLFIGSE